MINTTVVLIGIIVGIILITMIFNKKDCNDISKIFKQASEKYPDINDNYNITVDKLKHAGCMKSYERDKKCESLSPCITFVPYFCSQSGRRHYADDSCANEVDKQKCINDILSQTHVYKTINCNELNKLSPFPLKA